MAERAFLEPVRKVLQRRESGVWRRESIEATPAFSRHPSHVSRQPKYCQNWLLRALIVAVMLYSYLLADFADAAPIVRKIGNKTWIPNTTVKLFPQASAVLYSEPVLYLALTGGLGEYNTKSGEFSLYFISDNEAASDITSLALVRDLLWIATRGGIHIFNTTKKSFVRTITSRNSSLGSDDNISLIYDNAAQEMYILSFEHLQKYDLRNSKWEDLTHLYKDFNLGEPAGNPFGIQNENDLWIAAGAHAESRGGLFLYHKKDKSWALFRDELVGQKNAKRIDIDDMLLSPVSLYVLLNDTIARFDILQRKWDIFSPPALKNLHEEIWGLFSHFRGHYVQGTNCILNTIPGHNFVGEYPEIYFYNGLTLGLRQNSFSIFKGREPAAPINYAETPIIFKRPLGSDGISKALFLTNRGLEILEVNPIELNLVKKSEYFIDKGDFCDYYAIWRDDLVFLLFRKMPDPENAKAPATAKIFTVSLKQKFLEERSPGRVKWIEDMFVYNDTLFCSTDRGLMKWVNHSWVSTKEAVKAKVTPPPPPSRCQVFSLKGGKKIEFNPRGLFIY